jgi:predicted acyltransferase
MSSTKSERLLSLDVFRGITIAGMILVNNPGSWSNIYPPLRHAEWHGCTPTDLIFPFFLFIVGVAITFALTKRKERGDDQIKIMLQVFKRSAILFLLGLIMAGFPYFDLANIRIPGVLQRIAVVYLITSFIFLKFNVQYQTIITFLFLIMYWIMMTLVPVPGVGYANLEPTTNLAAWLDNFLLSGHLWSYTKVWDPEGILSTLPAISTALLGVLTGHLLKSNKDKTTKTVWMLIAGNILLVVGYIWDGWFPMNKSIWTSSYVVYTAGLALNFLAVCYWFIDVLGYKKWATPFVVYGLNAITVFFLSGIVAKLMYLIKITNAEGNEVSIKTVIYQNLF